MEVEPLVERPTDHRTLDPAVERGDGSQIVDPSDPARHHDRCGRYLRERPDPVEIRTLERTDPSHLGEQISADLEAGQPDEEIPKGQLEVGAARPHGVAVRLDPHHEPVVEPSDELLGPFPVAQRGRAEHDPLGAPREQCVDLLIGADAAARLHGYPQAAHGADDVGVRDRARSREVHIDDVEARFGNAAHPLVEGATPGGLFLDQERLAADGIPGSEVVEALLALGAESLMADAFQGFAILFARYC